MDIKVVRNFRDGICRPLQGNLILKVSNGKGKLAGLQQKKYTLVDVGSNSEQEIVPSDEKYGVFDITDVTGHDDYLYYSTIRKTSKESCIQETGVLSDISVRAALVRYSIKDGTSSDIYESEYSADEMTSQNMQIVVLDENYLLLQVTENVKNNGDVAYSRLKDIGLFDVANRTMLQINDGLLLDGGFETVVPLDGSFCAIKLGLSNLEYMQYGLNNRLKGGEEHIAIINVRQLISDLVLGKDGLPYEILDSAGRGSTFPYMKRLNGYLLYSRADFDRRLEELILWDNANKVSRVRNNDDLDHMTRKNQVYQIGDTLYCVKMDAKGTRLVNLDTHKTQWKLSAGSTIVAIEDDLVVVSKHVDGGFLRKEADFVYVFKFSQNYEAVLRERGRWAGCARTGNDELLIFCS